MGDDRYDHRILRSSKNRFGATHEVGIFQMDEYGLSEIKNPSEIFLEERSSFSPDSMVGMESNLRFPGKETMETKIFGRLRAWQNWVFQRPNAVGDNGALKLYGTGKKAAFDKKRV